MVPVVEALAGRGPGLGRHREARRWPRPPWRPGPPWSTTSPPSPVAGGRRDRRRLGGHAHAGRRPRTMQDDPRYDDVVAEVARAPARAGRRRPGRPGWPRSGSTPASASARPSHHNLALLRHLPELVAGRRRLRRCWWAPAASASSGCWRRARAAGRPAPSPTGSRARWPRPPGPWWRGAGMVRVHDVARHGRRPARLVDAVRSGAGMVKGKWAAGIPPRNFTWVIKDHLAVSERPGGFAPNHRRVRRQEEIIWLRVQGFDRVVSLLPSPHNLAAYDEEGLAWAHYPLAAHRATPAAGPRRPATATSTARWPPGERILVHQEELGDRVMGVVAGYLVWSDRLPSGPQADRRGRAHDRAPHGAEPGRELVASPAAGRHVAPDQAPGDHPAGPVSRTGSRSVEACGWSGPTASCPRSGTGPSPSRSTSTWPSTWTPARRSDDLADTVDYGALAARRRPTWWPAAPPAARGPGRRRWPARALTSDPRIAAVEVDRPQAAAAAGPRRGLDRGPGRRRGR